MEEPQWLAVEPEAEPSPLEPAPQKDPAPAQNRDWTKPLLILIVVLLIGVTVLQFLQMRHSSALEREVVALESDVTDLKPLRRDVDIIGSQLEALGEQVTAASASGSSTAIATQAADGSLPQFQSTSNDSAVIAHMELPEITGSEYYSGEQVTYPAGSDGKARVWLIWAHWCPHCQAELPDLNTWWPENASNYPNVDLASVTTAIDASLGNPLETYLDTEQFSFPVIVDDTGQVATQFGTTAFPFWVVTDNEGRVVLRVAGEIGIDNVEQIFAELETMATES